MPKTAAVRTEASIAASAAKPRRNALLRRKRARCPEVRRGCHTLRRGSVQIPRAGREQRCARLGEASGAELRR